MLNNISARALMALKLYRRDFPLVVFLMLMLLVISFFDPKNPKSPAVLKSVSFEGFTPGKFDGEFGSLINPLVKEAFKRPYLNGVGDEQKK
jgi:hypothetical protein